MTPLPPRAQRHLRLRYQVEGYTKDIVHDFEQRLDMIFGTQVNRVHMLDFARLTEEMGQTLADRMRMVYTGAEGQVLFTSHAWRRLFEIRGLLVREFILEFFSTCLHIADEMAEDGFEAYWLGSARVIPDKGDLRDHRTKISSDKDFLGPDPSYTFIRDPVRRLCHMLISYNISGRGQTPEKGRKSEARMSKGYFIGHLAEHFGLVSDEGLMGLSVIAHAWVAPGLERQPIVVAGAPEVAEGALDVDEGAQAILVPVQAPQPPPSAASTRTMEQRLSRLEEEVHSLRGDMGEQRELLDMVRSRIDEEMRRAESARGRRGSGSTRENRPGDEDLSRREMSGEHPESREKGEEERRIYLGFRVRSRERVSHGGKRLQRSEGARFGGGWAYRYTGPFCPLVCRLVISRLKSEDVVAPAYYEGCWVWGCSVRGSLGVFAGFVVTNCSYVKVCSQYSFDIIGVSRLLAVLVSMGLEVSLCRCWCVVSNCFTHLAGWPLHLWATVNTCPEAMDPVIGARGDECWLGGSCWSVVGEGRCGIDLYSDSEFGWRRVLFTRVFVAAVKWLSSVGGQDLRRGLAWASLVQIMLRGVAHNWGLGVTFCDEGEGSREFYRSVAVPAFLIGLGGGGDLDLFWGGRDMVEERWVAISDGGWGGWSGPAIQGLGTVAVVAFEWGSGVLGHISLGLCGNVLSGVPRRRQSGIESWLTAIVELVAIT
ncbi:hypothetical protein Tco_0871859 [Tanacetum coccineum]